METIVVYSSGNSNRLKYALDWLLKERLQLSYTIIQDEQQTKNLPFFISYGKALPNGLSIPDAELLWEAGVKKTEPPTGLWKDVPTLFSIDNAGCTLPFDLL